MLRDRGPGRRWRSVIALAILLIAIGVILLPAGKSSTHAPRSVSGSGALELVGPASSLEARSGGDLAVSKGATVDATEDILIRGDVVSAPTGDGISNAVVTVFPPATSLLTDPRLVVVTNEQGAFRIEASGMTLGDAPWQLEVRHPEYLRSQSKVLPGESARVRIEMQRGAVLRGTVRNDAGSPIGGARVVARIPGNRIAWPLIEDVYRRGPYGDGGVSITDEQGRFSIACLAADESYVLSATKLQHERLEHPPRRVRPGLAGEQDLVLHPVAIAKLQCVDATSGRALALVGIAARIPRGCQLRTYHPVQTLYGTTPTIDVPASHLQFIRAPSPGPEVLGPVVLEGRCHSPGYVEKAFRVELAWGEVTSRVVEMERRDPGLALGKAELRAVWSNGTKYHGPLSIWLLDSLSQGTALTIHQEKSGPAPVLELPPGDYTLGLMDFQTGGWWLTEHVVVHLRVLAGQSTTQVVEVPGAMIPLKVVAADGEEIRDYGLGVDSRALDGEPWSDSFGILFLANQARGDHSVQPFVLVPLGPIRLFFRNEHKEDSFVVETDVSEPGVQDLLIVKLPK